MSTSLEPDTVAAGMSIVEDSFLFSTIWHRKASLRNLRAGRSNLVKAFEEVHWGYVFSFGDGATVKMAPYHVTNILDMVVFENLGLPSHLKIGRCARFGFLEIVGLHYAVPCC